MAWQPPTGVSRGPEVHGVKVVDPQRDVLRDALRRFEAAVDKTDPEQLAARGEGGREAKRHNRSALSRRPP